MGPDKKEEHAMISDTIWSYYTMNGPFTDLSEHGRIIDGLPSDIGSLVRIIQGMMIHGHWLKQYGLTIDAEKRKEDMNIRPVRERIRRILEENAAPLSSPREAPNRQIGCCRDFSTMLAAILRHKGIPARARCGFGRYFLPNHFEDHWITEYFDAKKNRWIMVDAQIDSLQRKNLRLKFDTLDMPRGQFVTGGEAWLMCREGGYSSDKFGIFEFKGIDFVIADLIHDIASLGKRELLPWDYWGASSTKYDAMDDQARGSLDDAARITLDPDTHFNAIQEYAEHDPRFRLPETIISYWDGQREDVSVVGFNNNDHNLQV
jgi:hypothetical protein